MSGEGNNSGATSGRDSNAPTSGKRVASVYDAVAGRIGSGGFLTAAQRENPNLLPATPEEVLLRRVGAPDEIPYNYYDADQELEEHQSLPNSDLLKAIHTYVSDFYAARILDYGTANFRAFDETALLALGILLEEASKEALGQTGDMVLTEPEESYHDSIESKFAKHQIIGKVEPRKSQQDQLRVDIDGEESEQEESPRKRRK